MIFDKTEYLLYTNKLKNNEYSKSELILLVKCIKDRSLSTSDATLNLSEILLNKLYTLQKEIKVLNYALRIRYVAFMLKFNDRLRSYQELFNIQDVYITYLKSIPNNTVTKQLIEAVEFLIYTIDEILINRRDTWDDVLRLWSRGIVMTYPDYIENPFVWRTSAITKDKSVHFKEEFIEDLTLPVYQNYKPFMNKFKTGETIVSFKSSRGNIVVVPSPQSGKDYSNIKSFIDTAPVKVQQQFWKKVADIINNELKTVDKLWLSTYDHGVNYFHLRISYTDKLAKDDVKTSHPTEKKKVVLPRYSLDPRFTPYQVRSATVVFPSAIRIPPSSHTRLIDIINHKDIDWKSLSGNPAAIRMLEVNIDKVNWTSLSANPAAVHILNKNLKNVDWYEVSANPRAVPLLKKHFANISWGQLNKNKLAVRILTKNSKHINLHLLSSNECAIHILQKNLDRVDWRALSANPNAISILEKNLNKVDWSALSGNPNAVHILEKKENFKNIDWYELSRNPSAMRILEKNIHRVNWDGLSQNTNSKAIAMMLDDDLNNVNWNWLSGNPNAIGILMQYPYNIDTYMLSSNPGLFNFKPSRHTIDNFIKLEKGRSY